MMTEPQISEAIEALKAHGYNIVMVDPKNDWACGIANPVPTALEIVEAYEAHQNTMDLGPDFWKTRDQFHELCRLVKPNFKG